MNILAALPQIVLEKKHTISTNHYKTTVPHAQIMNINAMFLMQNLNSII